MLLKTVMIGMNGVGKTTILYRSKHQKLNTNTHPTIGIDFISKQYQRDYEEVYLEIWDTAGQEVYKSIISSYFKGSKGVFLVVSAEKTVQQNLSVIQTQLNHFGQFEIPKNVIIIFNKIDLIDENKLKQQLQANKQSLRLLRQKFDIKDVISISAYTSPLQQINKMLQNMLDYILVECNSKKEEIKRVKRQVFLNSQITIASEEINLRPLNPKLKKKSSKQIKKKCC